MQQKLHYKKRAIIVGATSGIGLELAKGLLNEGWIVGVAGRRTEELKKNYNLSSKQVFFQTIDITHEDATNGLHQLISQMGGVDLVVQASGIGFQNPVLDKELEVKIAETNAVGFVRMVSTAYQYFRDNGGGHIAVISSIAGTKGIGISPSYSATKRLQNTYIEALAQLSNMYKHRIYFTDIRPGFVKTALLDGDKKYPMLMTPSRVAKHIIKAINKRKRVVVIDWRYRCVVFVWRLIPNWLWERLKIRN